MTAESRPPKVTLNLPRRTLESLTSRSSPSKKRAMELEGEGAFVATT